MRGDMRKTDRLGTVNRREAVGVLAATPILLSGSVAAAPFGGAAWASASAPSAASPATGSAAHGAKTLAKLTAEHFEPLVGETFGVGDAVVTLRSVRRGHKSGRRFRRQFAVLFDAPPNVSIGSAPAPVSHPAIGRYDLFVTQIVDPAGRPTLQICFS
jgi:hypothetical protein